MTTTRAPKPKPARTTWASVAEHLGCSRETVDNLRKLPGAPADKDPARWAEWVTANGHLKGGSRRLTEIKCLIAEEELKKKRRENAVSEGELIPLEDVCHAAAQAAEHLARLLGEKLLLETPPRLTGRPIAEIRVELQATRDAIIRQWNTELESCTHPN